MLLVVISRLIWSSSCSFEGEQAVHAISVKCIHMWKIAIAYVRTGWHAFFLVTIPSQLSLCITQIRLQWPVRLRNRSGNERQALLRCVSAPKRTHELRSCTHRRTHQQMHRPTPARTHLPHNHLDVFGVLTWPHLPTHQIRHREGATPCHGDHRRDQKLQSASEHHFLFSVFNLFFLLNLHNREFLCFVVLCLLEARMPECCQNWVSVEFQPRCMFSPAREFSSLRSLFFCFVDGSCRMETPSRSAASDLKPLRPFSTPSSWTARSQASPTWSSTWSTMRAWIFAGRFALGTGGGVGARGPGIGGVCAWVCWFRC